VGLLAWSTKLERKIAFPWQSVGLLLAIIFGGISIYTEFIRVSAPKLQLEVLSNEPVLDVREKLPDLEVFYQAQDIAKSGKTLSVLLVRVANRGTADILSSYYASNAPIEIGINGGTIVKADVSETSNDYLRSTVSLLKQGPQEELSPIILEQNEWFTVKILALHDIDKQPNVTVSGKIAGQRDIQIVKSDSNDSKANFWINTFSGSVASQVVRIVSYPIISVIIAIFIVLPPSLISDASKRRRRKRSVNIFKMLHESTLKISDKDNFIFDTYITGGFNSVMLLSSTIRNDNDLQLRMDSYRALSEDKIGIDADIEDAIPVGVAARHAVFSYRHLAGLLKSGMIEQRTDGKWAVVPDRVKILTAFIEYLKSSARE
jgi:hypothetical protein